MSVKHAGYSSTFIHSGRFDFKAFYAYIYEVVTGQGYFLTGESHSQKQKGAGDKVEVSFDFEKLVDDYTKFTISVFIFSTNIKPVIVKRDDKELKLDEGKVKVTVKGDIVTDYMGKWEKSSFLEKVRGFYEKYLFAGTLNRYDEEIYGEVFSIIGDIKAFLNDPHFL